MNIRKTALEFHLLYVNVSIELAAILIKEGRKENDKKQENLQQKEKEKV